MTLIRRLVTLVYCAFICSNGAHLLGQNGNQSVENDIKTLYSDKAKARVDAANRLAAAGSPAIPLLVPVVCDRTKAHFDVAWPAAAKILGDLKAEGAAPCLVDLLMYNYPSIGPVMLKPDSTLAAVDPAFAALVNIGEPAVPAIRKHLPFLGPQAAIMALRVLRAINTPSAREAVEAYIRVLQDQVRFADQVLRDFDEKPGKGDSLN